MDENQSIENPPASYSLLHISIVSIALVLFLGIGYVVGKYYQRPVVTQTVTNTCETAPKVISEDINVNKNEILKFGCESEIGQKLEVPVKKEFVLDSYDNVTYKLVWQEIPGFYNLRFKTPVMFISVDSSGAETVENYFLFTLDGGNFGLPCEKEITENDYFPAVVKEYKERCSNLKTGEVFLTKSAGATSAQWPYLINLVDHSLKELWKDSVPVN